jgi:oligopeptide/dipeptide ABC transporter ATP-binding protein
MVKDPSMTTDKTTANPLLEVDSLAVELPVDGQLRPILRDVSFSIAPGEALGLVGESGSGKSMTAKAVDKLLPPGARVAGSIRFDGREVHRLSGADLRRYRAEVAMIFQDPRVHVNPVRRVGDFMTEVLRTNLGVRPREAEERAVEMLARVGIPDGGRRLGQYPHELSGGLLQRVMIASALLTGPRLLLADEPTTALDVTVEAQVLALIRDLQDRTGVGLMLITHDMGVVAEMADRVVVFYAGQVVETGTADEILDRPQHPYTRALLDAIPRRDTPRDQEMPAIPGAVPALNEMPSGCRFVTRCSDAAPECEAFQPLRHISGRQVRCWRPDEEPGVLAPMAEVAR